MMKLINLLVKIKERIIIINKFPFIKYKYMKVINNKNLSTIQYPIYVNLSESNIILKEYEKIVFNICKNIKKHNHPIDISFIAKGSSGIIIASIISNNLLNKYNINSNILVIRKPNEVSHARTHINNDIENNLKRYIVVDDFIFSGNTILSILKELKEFYRVDYKIDIIVSGSVSNNSITNIEQYSNVRNLYCGN